MLSRKLNPLPDNPDWSFEGWDRWHAEQRANRRIAYFVFEQVPKFFGGLARRAGAAKWWLLHRLHPHHRYHVVKTGLPPGYYDFDDQILHACFACLKQHVEIEAESVTEELRGKPFLERREAWRTCGGDPLCAKEVEARTEICALYEWWVVVRPSRQDPWAYEGPSDHAKAHEAHLAEWAYDREDQEMLHKLIDVRPYLWT